MKQKLLTLMTLLLCVCSGAWADDITWNTADNSASSDVSLSANYTITGNDASNTLTYANPNGCKRLKNNGGLYMNGASQWNNSKAQRHFTFKAPSSAGTVSITFAAINGKTDGTGSAIVRIYGGTTVAYDVSTLNSSLTSPTIAGLQAGTSDIIITFTAKCTIKEIKWTDVAAPSYVTAYANDFTATPMGAASVSYSNMSAISSDAVTGWMGWASSYSNGYKSSSSNCSATLTFATPLTLASNGEDCGRIRIYWGHSSNGKTLGLKVNDSSVSFSPTSVATTLYPNTLNVAEYTIPSGTTSISSIQPSGSSSSGTYLFRIEVLTYPSVPGAISFDPAAGSVEEGTSVTLSSVNATTIKYQWGASAVDGEGSWESATTYSAESKPTVPAVGSTNNVLSVKASNANGDTYGSAAYTITGADNTAPTLTGQSIAENATNIAVAGDITLTFDENVEVADASGFTLTGGAGTISGVTAEDNVVTIAYTGLDNNTTYTLAVADGAITDIASAHNAYAGTAIHFTTVKETLAKPTINGVCYFTGSQTVSISSIEGASIQYKIGDGEYTAYTAPFEISDSKTVTAKATHVDYLDSPEATLAMYQIEVPAGQADVSETITWDFQAGGNAYTADEIGGTAERVELLSSVTAYSAVAEAAKISFLGRNVYRAGYAQAHGFVINTMVPGKLEIKYSLTNGKTTRSLYLNGESKATVTNNSNTRTVEYTVPAGENIVYGFDVTDNAANNLRFYCITFTASPTVTVGAKGYATYCNSSTALDFTGKSIKAYTIGSEDGSALTLTNVNKVAKNTPLLLYSETSSDSQTIPAIADSETMDATTGNKLVAGDGNAHTWVENSTEHYILYTGGTTPGFYRANNSNVAIGKAYLDLTGVTGGARAFSFDLNLGEGETTGIANANVNHNANDNYYNLAGQRVAQPTKGLYIVNGKKVVIK